MKRYRVRHWMLAMIICAMLCGCGATPQTTPETEGGMSREKQDSTASLKTEDKAAESETEKSDSDAASPKSAYQELLDGIYDLILAEDKETDLELAAQALNGIMDAGYSRTPEETLEHIGYALWDLNADGTPELVIGGVSEERDGKCFGRDIYAVYTCVQGEVHCVCSGWSRNRVGWMGENAFYCLSSGGAAYTKIGQYELLPNAAEWSGVDFCFTEEDGIYHNQTGIYDKEQAEKLDMTQDEFWALDDALYARVLEFEMTPFSSGT